MCGDGCKIQGKCYMLYQMSVCHHEGSLPYTIIQFMIIFSCMSIVSLSMHIIKLAGLILANGEKITKITKMKPLHNYQLLTVFSPQHQLK